MEVNFAAIKEVNNMIQKPSVTARQHAFLSYFKQDDILSALLQIGVTNLD